MEFGTMLFRCGYIRNQSFDFFVLSCSGIPRNTCHDRQRVTHTTMITSFFFLHVSITNEKLILIATQNNDDTMAKCSNCNYLLNTSDACFDPCLYGINIHQLAWTQTFTILYRYSRNMATADGLQFHCPVLNYVIIRQLQMFAAIFRYNHIYKHF